ncbi:MAG: membrane protein insertion efficiency factor YidD [Puniceicoccales bacterium]|nr:membrane protein insertion efficiency factor YidD [Puniceicoccales bacterium]
MNRCQKVVPFPMKISAILDKAARSIALLLIKFYQVVLSPLKICLFGTLCQCRFRLTCSQYAKQMYATHNFFKATLLTIGRLMKCQPFYRPQPSSDEEKSETLPKLYFSNTKADKNLKYLLGCTVESDIAVIKQATELTILAHALEINRLKNESKATEVVALEGLKTGKKPKLGELVAKFVKHVTGKKKVAVHRNFPFWLGFDLSVKGFKLIIDPHDTLAERSIKSEHEVKCIGEVLSVINGCFKEVRKILHQSKIGKRGILEFQGSELTSGFIRGEIEKYCYSNGCLAENTIVACGCQSADPHCQGYGPIRANEFIVIDLFPFHRTSGYYGDITRTFLRGIPTEAQINMYESVKAAQEMAHRDLKHGVTCSGLMGNTLKFLESKNYKTDKAASIPYGMFHSLGHGFGLEIHEEPFISDNETVLKSGNVITLEPGLYYPETGGVRIEDNFLIADEGCEKLSEQISYDWVVN